MINQKIIIYDFDILFYILKELEDEINFEIVKIAKENLSTIQMDNTINFLLVTSEKILTVDNQYILNQFPIKISKLIEKFNIEFLRQKFNEQTEVNVGNYKINLNSKELTFNQVNLKLTEKETNIIIYLSKLNKVVKIDELKIKVWGHQSELDTHTVETHIYRLRKKILNTFKDNRFIISKENGYCIIKI
tara:strand:+ start:910 stop:1479 length:570 start_codon:yes stop_codon:yes gene_type:complete